MRDLLGLRRFAWVIVLLVLGCGGAEKTEEDDSPQPGQLTLKVWLQYFPGGREGAAVARITVSDQSEGDEAETSRPGKEDLQDREQFQLRRKETGSLIDFDLEGIVSFFDEGVEGSEPQSYSRILKVSRLKKPVAGDRIEAVFLYRGESYVSNEVIVPPDPPSDEPFQNLQREARALELLDDPDSLMAVSTALLEQDPQAVAGYWFRSLAFERQGQLEEALAAAEAALERLPHPDRVSSEQGVKGHSDGGRQIFGRIGHLQARLKPR